MEKTFSLENLRQKKYFLIAEAGINHNGSVEMAKELIDMAVRVGADCVKFQKRTPELVLCKEALEAEYQSPNAFGKTYGEHRDFLEFNDLEFEELYQYANKRGIMMTASPWDTKSLDLLIKLDVPFIKVASADLTNFPFLEKIAQTQKPIVLSTGMVNMDLVEKAVAIILEYNSELVLLQCTSSYPTPPSELNLKVIETYQREFPNLVIGYSGHEEDIFPTLTAYTLGAKVIERHITLDKTLKGSDQKASLNEVEFRELNERLDSLATILGDGCKKIQKSEQKPYEKLGKSIVATRRLLPNEIITEEMITTKSPAPSMKNQGISPVYFKKLIGSKVLKKIECDTVIPYNSVDFKIK